MTEIWVSSVVGVVRCTAHKSFVSSLFEKTKARKAFVLLDTFVQSTANYTLTYTSTYTTVQKVLARFDVSKYVYVESFKQHAFNPILLNRATGYCHRTFIKHCLCFEVFHLHCSVYKKINRKIFLGQKNEHRNLRRHEIPFKKQLDIAFWSKMKKAIEKLRQWKNCKNLSRVGRLERFTKVF